MNTCDRRWSMESSRQTFPSHLSFYGRYNNRKFYRMGFSLYEVYYHERWNPLRPFVCTPAPPPTTILCLDLCATRFQAVALRKGGSIGLGIKRTRGKPSLAVPEYLQSFPPYLSILPGSKRSGFLRDAPNVTPVMKACNSRLLKLGEWASFN